MPPSAAKPGPNGRPGTRGRTVGGLARRSQVRDGGGVLQGDGNSTGGCRSRRSRDEVAHDAKGLPELGDLREAGAPRSGSEEPRRRYRTKAAVAAT